MPSEASLDTTSQNAPVGVLDSGLGGLSVLRALRRRLAHEDFLYCADCGNAPWGDKPQEWVEKRCDQIAHFLVSVHGVKALVLACNTATALAADHLRSWMPVPVIGIEPAVKPAAKLSAARKVGVLATAGTIASPRYRSLLTRFASDIDVMSVGAPGLMECVERGEFDTAHTLELLRHYVEPMLENGVDTLVLGCTHYPFLMTALRRITGPDINVIEPGDAVAAVTQTRLSENGRLRAQGRGRELFYIRAGAAHENVLRVLWPAAADETVLELPF